MIQQFFFSAGFIIPAQKVLKRNIARYLVIFACWVLCLLELFVCRLIELYYPLFLHIQKVSDVF